MATFSTNCPAFEPRLNSQQSFGFASQQVIQQQQQFTAQPSFNPSAPAMQPSVGFSDSVQNVPAFVPRLSKAQSFQPVQSAYKSSSFQQNSPSFTPKIQVPVPQAMPEYKRQANFMSKKTFESQPVDDFKCRQFAPMNFDQAPVDDLKSGRQFAPEMCKTLQHSISLMGFANNSPLKMGGHQKSFFDGTSSPCTMSTIASSQGSNNSLYSSEDESGFNEDFDSSAMHQLQLMRNQSFRSNKTIGCAQNANGNSNTWKKKVKTELCKFWLQGLPCENLKKDQGCGFAHGQEELQKKKGLSRQYLTSVCKNFLEHPSKCTYGQRCIFQHPTYDVKTRQSYTKMMQDNTRYTAMRLFQDIEGSDTVYINTYAATTPRLPAFRQICSSAKDNGEDYVDKIEEEEVDEDDSTVLASSVISRDFFRQNTM